MFYRKHYIIIHNVIDKRIYAPIIAIRLGSMSNSLACFRTYEAAVAQSSNVPGKGFTKVPRQLNNKGCTNIPLTY